MAPPAYNKRFWRKQTLLLKQETTYGADAAPSAAANAMLLTDTSFTPFQGEEVERDYYLAHFGHQGIMPTALYGQLEFGVDFAASGAAGTAPAWGPLMRACGMAEVIVAATSVTYTPVSSAFESATAYLNLDGVQHALLGARGSWTLETTPARIPRFKFKLLGLLGVVADTALPAATLTPWRKARPISKANTVVSLHGVEQIAETISLDYGAQVEPRMLIGEESIQIVDRKTSGSITVEGAPLATKNWFSSYQDETLGAFSLTQGVGAGNIVEIAAPSVQIGRPAYGQTQGIVNTTLPLMLLPLAGNDDFSIIVR